jgi:hypothetical protein
VSDKQTPADPRAAAVADHFNEWHGAAPEAHEIEALLKRIDGADPLRSEACEAVRQSMVETEARVADARRRIAAGARTATARFKL